MCVFPYRINWGHEGVVEATVLDYEVQVVEAVAGGTQLQ